MPDLFFDLRSGSTVFPGLPVRRARGNALWTRTPTCQRPEQDLHGSPMTGSRQPPEARRHCLPRRVAAEVVPICGVSASGQSAFRSLRVAEVLGAGIRRWFAGRSSKERGRVLHRPHQILKSIRPRQQVDRRSKLFADQGGSMAHETFGTRLRSLRERAGMTQTGLAQKVGTDKYHISDWERNDEMPETAMVERLAAALGASAAKLLTGRPAD